MYNIFLTSSMPGRLSLVTELATTEIQQKQPGKRVTITFFILHIYNFNFTENIKGLIFPVILLARGGHRVVLRAPFILPVGHLE